MKENPTLSVVRALNIVMFSGRPESACFHIAVDANKQP
jgi:hypothetical protein